MINRKRILWRLFVLVVVAAFFMSSASVSYAQSNPDWSDPVNISNSGSAINPTLVRDFTGTLHAIWENRSGGHKYSQSADGTAWTAPQSVNFPFLPTVLPIGLLDINSGPAANMAGPPPVLLADQAGSIHVFWIDAEASLFYGQTAPPDLATPDRWKLTTRLARGVLNFSAIMDSRGILHVTYIHNVATSNVPVGIYYMQSNLGGGFWSTPAKLYESEYLSSMTLDDSFIRIASNDSQTDQKIYVTWDVRALKRVYMTVSLDAGLSWMEAQQIKGPEDTGGLTPFNLNVEAFDNNVLLIWQEGELGSDRCTVYSQWSDDNGNTWSESLAVLGGISDCPKSTRFLAQSDGIFVSLLVGQLDSTMIAWDGKQWSLPQVKTRLPAFTNPLTFDTVMLGCRYDLVWDDRLFVVGCDQGSGNGGDIWFLSRALEPVEGWFAPSSIWEELDGLISGSEKPEKISGFTSMSDNVGYVHAVWIQSEVGEVISPIKKIVYARWDGRQWSNPSPVITLSDRIPVHLSLTVDSNERLLLTWLDKSTGDILFSWAKLDKATSASEWALPRILPSPSQINTHPDLVVDGAGRIAVVYAVPVNENRGVYVVQSSDGGDTWSLPQRAFDAVSAAWERVEQPRVCLGSEGELHLSFAKSSERVGQPAGLYYVRSSDGGVTWSDAQALTEELIHWQQIVCSSDGTVHVLWQEFDGLVFANLSRVSLDSGGTWGQSNAITGVNPSVSNVAVAMNAGDSLHFIQLFEKTGVYTANQENVTLQDLSWDGSRWNLEADKAFTIIGRDINYSLSTDITSTGYLGVFLSAEYANPAVEQQDQIFTFGRFLENQANNLQSLTPLIPTPATNDNGSSNNPPPTSSPTSDQAAIDAGTTSVSTLQRNLIGVIIVVFVIGLFMVFRKRSPKGK
ncbi:MAG: glycoside hydrolase [Anaerolineae bacterium]|nr:glycoside hydrolase [Anaerolineae bacterium]